MIPIRFSKQYPRQPPAVRLDSYGEFAISATASDSDYFGPCVFVIGNDGRSRPLAFRDSVFDV